MTSRLKKTALALGACRSSKYSQSWAKRCRPRRCRRREVADLADKDDHGDTAGKPRDHRRRDEVDDLAELKIAQQDDDDPSHDGDRPDAFDPYRLETTMSTADMAPVGPEI